ncbi:MAG: hypothetical protein K0R21_784 [Anaerocolumna sp.]|jgi:hypothetical protein|nr:hypothetical protein [Anaerocolumna sp.]
MSRRRRSFFILIPIVIFSLIFILYQYTNRTVYNDADAYGNTPGNLLNGGLFSELDDKIYFSNPKDDGTLYLMDQDLSNFKKINDDKAGYINSVGNYLYYVRMNYEKESSSSSIFSFNNTGIYRIKPNGSSITMLYDDPSGVVNVSGNNLYYQHYNELEGLTFYTVGIDGLKERMISEDGIVPLSIQNNILYYSGTEDDHNINTLNLESDSKSLLYTGNTYAPIVNHNYIYFMSLDDNYEIRRINIDGSNPTPVVNQRVSSYNISADGKYLYYQVDDSDNSGVFLLNLETMESEVILQGNFKGLHVAGDYFFFTDFDDTNTYYITLGTTTGLSIFDPPNLSK